MVNMGRSRQTIELLLAMRFSGRRLLNHEAVVLVRFVGL